MIKIYKVFFIISIVMILFLMKLVINTYSEGIDNLSSMKVYRESVFNLSNYLKESKNINNINIRD